MSENSSSFLSFMFGFKDLFVRYWYSLVMFLALSICSKYLGGISLFALSVTLWAIHCRIIDDNRIFSEWKKDLTSYFW